MSDNEDKRDERDESDAPTEDASQEHDEETASAGDSDDTQKADSDDADESDSDDEGASASHTKASSGDDSPKGRMSAGARLAAAKAAKAVVKAAKKEERRAAQEPEEGPSEPTATEPVSDDPVEQLNESELGRAALRAGRWWETNQQVGWIALGVAALAIVGVLAWRFQSDSSTTAAGELLTEAVEIASARIAPEGDTEPDEGEEPERTYPSQSARNEAALEAYEAVIAQYPDHAASGVARLGAGRALLALGRNDEAREVYQAAFDRNGRSGTIAWQALEGVAFAQEAAGDRDAARETYERLGNIDGHAYEQVAHYHGARLMLAAGQRDEARTALRELVEALRADTVEGSSEPRFPYLLSQAEVRLRELDPSSATSTPSLLGGGGGGIGGGLGGGEGGGAGDISPEQLQELIRQFQARQQQAGGEGGGE